MVFKRRLNRDIKERQILLHKTSLLCRLGRIFFYNRLFNNTILMQKALKLLPSKSAYPPDRGTEIKYFQSMVTWFKSVFKLKSQNLYPENSASKTKSKALLELVKQIENKEARCKQDMIFIFVILLRGMGLQCRLVVNMQPLPLKPAQSDLLTIKMKKDDESGPKKLSEKTKSSKKDGGHAAQTNIISDNSKSNAKSIKKEKLSEKDKNNDNKKISVNETKSGENNKNEAAPENLKETLSLTKSYKDAANPTKFKKQENMRKNPKSIEKDGNPFTLHTNEMSLNPENEECENDFSKETSNKMEITETKVVAIDVEMENYNPEEEENSQKENQRGVYNKPTLSRLQRTKQKGNGEELEGRPSKKSIIDSGSTMVPKIVVPRGNDKKTTELPSCSRQTRNTRSRSKSPHAHISTAFLLQGANCKKKFPGIMPQNTNIKKNRLSRKSPTDKAKISTDFLKSTNPPKSNKRVLRSRQKTNEVPPDDSKTILIPQLDGADNGDDMSEKKNLKSRNTKKKQPNLKKLKVQSSENSDEDFEPLPCKKPKVAPTSSKNRRVFSSDEENDKLDSEEGTEGIKRNPTAGDTWVEVWCDAEEQWVCVDIFKGKIHCVDSIRKSASASLAYVFAFQNDLSIKDVTARYCHNWTTVVRKSRVDNTWLDAAISKYLGRRSKRDIKEDQELRRIHEEKPMPTAISEYKNHPFYALERHLLKFEALYPPDAPALGYVRGEPVYSRDCVHTLHSREIWLKQARTVKLGEKPYKIVKARPKWDRITQTVIKDQPLEIFGYWQTQEYDPPTAENGLVPRNAYGNVELFKMSMLPKKTKHIRLPGLNRICKKLGVDCANAVVGFDFHQGACHPTYDGFVVCEEFEEQVVAAWHQDQEEQERKETEKYEARVYGNWKKLIRGLLIRERLKLKYNF